MAPLVADGFRSSVLIQADWFLGLWRRGAIDSWLPEAKPQTAVAAAAAASTAGTFARADCVAVYDGFIPPADLPWFLTAAGLAAVHYAVLLPPETMCVERVINRQGHGFTSESAARGMYRDFADAAPSARHLLTGAGPEGRTSPADIALRVLDGVAAGSLLWTAH